MFLVIVAIATSRSVIIPTPSPFSPSTGRTPQSPSYIFHATSAKRSVDLQQVGLPDMISRTFMLVILRHIASFARVAENNFMPRTGEERSELATHQP